jgi:hypothetical protein
VTPQKEIEATLTTMFAQWNAEEQASYLTHYWDSDELRWSMKGLWYKGLSSMKAVYGQGFPPGAMGITKIFEVEVQMLTDDIGVALYRWTHEFPHEVIAGCTSQIFRKLGGRWLVVHENSARVPKD